jgi:hypothetical protein
MSLKSLPDESIHFLTRKLALHVILAAAYGYQLTRTVKMRFRRAIGWDLKMLFVQSSIT